MIIQTIFVQILSPTYWVTDSLTISICPINILLHTLIRASTIDLVYTPQIGSADEKAPRETGLVPPLENNRKSLPQGLLVFRDLALGINEDLPFDTIRDLSPGVNGVPQCPRIKGEMQCRQNMRTIFSKRYQLNHPSNNV